MDSIRLGRSGLQVSRLCLGTMTFGAQADEATSRSMLDAAADAGVNFIDTAINYRCQKAERTIGAVLRTLINDPGEPLARDEIFVSTKAGYVPEDSDIGRPAAVLLEDLKNEGVIEDSDVAAGIHCMHPGFLEH